MAFVGTEVGKFSEIREFVLANREFVFANFSNLCSAGRGTRRDRW